jgi:hypothetical protein
MIDEHRCSLPSGNAISSLDTCLLAVYRFFRFLCPASIEPKVILAPQRLIRIPRDPPPIISNISASFSSLKFYLLHPVNGQASKRTQHFSPIGVPLIFPPSIHPIFIPSLLLLLYTSYRLRNCPNFIPSLRYYKTFVPLLQSIEYSPHFDFILPQVSYLVPTSSTLVYYLSFNFVHIDFDYTL